MSDNYILLSICIPTYNRADYLKESLRVLLPQLQRVKDEVEVLVSDNCSSDNTNLVVEEAVIEYKIDISYSRNEENIGGNKNMAKVVSKSHGKYVFIMGDDDYLSPDFISILFRLIRREQEYGLIFFNRLSGDENCSHCQVSDPFFVGLERQLTPSLFIMEVLNKANFMSSIVFNRECWILGDRYHKEVEYFGYNWFARLYWGALDLKEECIYYYMPLVIQRNGPKTWTKFWPQYVISSLSNIFFDLNHIVPGVYDKWRDQLKAIIPTVLPSVAFYQDYYRRDDVKKMIFKHLSASEQRKYSFYLIPGVKYYNIVRFKIQNMFK